MNRPRVLISPGAAFLAAALFFFLRPEELAALLPALLVHELGHLAAILALGLRLTAFRAEPGGFTLEYGGETGTAGRALIPAAGPLAGLLYALIVSRLGDRFCLSAGLSLLLSLFNLLPAPPLDGGRIAAALAEALPDPGRGARLCRLLGLGTGLALLGAGLPLLMRGRGAALALAGAWLLFSALRPGEGLVKISKIR